MLYILTGQDDFTITETLRKIKGGVGDASLLEANTSVMEAEGLSAERLRAECATTPFMTEKRLIVVNDLLWRFHPREKTAAAAAPKRGLAKSKVSGFQDFAAVLGQLPASTALVLVDTRIKDKDLKKLGDINPLFRAVAESATVQLMPLRSGKELLMWIQVKTKDAGGNISPAAATALARLIGGNLWIMSNEIAKLVAYAAGRTIEERDVRHLVSNASESTIFSLIDAVFEGRPDIAVSVLQRLLQTGEQPAQILAMLARQLQLIVRLKDMKEHRGPSKMEMQQKLGLMQEFVWLKTAAQAERFDIGQIKEIYRQLRETDLAIKTGRSDTETAVSLLIAEIAATTKSASRTNFSGH